MPAPKKVAKKTVNTKKGDTYNRAFGYGGTGENLGLKKAKLEYEKAKKKYDFEKAAASSPTGVYKEYDNQKKKTQKIAKSMQAFGEATRSHRRALAADTKARGPKSTRSQ